jgi:phosphomannomutase
VLIRGVSGVRGLAASEVTPALARQYGWAFASLYPGELAIGWDSRPGGAELVAAVAGGIREAGGKPLETGIVPTPTVGMAVRRHGLAGGVVVTASHNPEEYNGLKFFSPRGIFLTGEEVGRLFDAVDVGDRSARRSGGARSGDRGDTGPTDPSDRLATPSPDGSTDHLEDALDEHIEIVLGCTLVDAGAVSAAVPRVVVDAVNGAGSVILPELLRRMGCEVVELNTTAGAGFPRGAEPIPEHLSALSGAVLGESAAVGFACDPDADRLAIVDEGGRPVGEELTLAIATRVVLRARPGPIVANASTSRMMDDLADEFGVPLYRTPIGEINVVARMFEVDAVVGGEGNGGVILPDVHMGRDAATAAALVVSGIAGTESGRPSELVSMFRPYSTVKTKLRLDGVTREGIVQAMTAAFPDGDLDTIDGAKIAWPDSWIHARMSGTEPVVRVIAEGVDAGDAQRLVDRAVSAVTEAAEGA